MHGLYFMTSFKLHINKQTYFIVFQTTTFILYCINICLSVCLYRVDSLQAIQQLKQNFFFTVVNLPQTIRKNFYSPEQ